MKNKLFDPVCKKQLYCTKLAKLLLKYVQNMWHKQDLRPLSPNF